MAKMPLPENIDALVRHPAAPVPDDLAAYATAREPLQAEDGEAWPLVPEPDREPQTGRMDDYFVS